jgi:hypothetical protein
VTLGHISRPKREKLVHAVRLREVVTAMTQESACRVIALATLAKLRPTLASVASALDDARCNRGSWQATAMPNGKLGDHRVAWVT